MENKLVWYNTLLRNITRCVQELSGIVWKPIVDLCKSCGEGRLAPCNLIICWVTPIPPLICAACAGHPKGCLFGSENLITNGTIGKQQP